MSLCGVGRSDRGCELLTADTEAYVSELTIAELWVFPLKGAAGISAREWPLDGFGPVHDRRWMVVDERGTFVSQRSDPSLGQVRTSFDDGVLVLESATAGVLRLPPGGAPTAERRGSDDSVGHRDVADANGSSVPVRVWLDEVDAIDCGSDAAAFITRHLGRSARIVFMPDSTLRPVPQEYAPAGGRVSFADAFPLLIIGDGSLIELNGRLAEPISMVRFRPNVVVSGVAPHEEDTWRVVRLGDVECDVVKPCARCAVPTIDPATGVGGREPSRTLAGYRRWDGHIWFGQNAVHRGPGTLRTGAAVEVIESGAPEPPLLA